jgi:hypothetical protein
MCICIHIHIYIYIYIYAHKHTHTRTRTHAKQDNLHTCIAQRPSRHANRSEAPRAHATANPNSLAIGSACDTSQQHNSNSHGVPYSRDTQTHSDTTSTISAPNFRVHRSDSDSNGVRCNIRYARDRHESIDVSDAFSRAMHDSDSDMRHHAAAHTASNGVGHVHLRNGSLNSSGASVHHVDVQNHAISHRRDYHEQTGSSRAKISTGAPMSAASDNLQAKYNISSENSDVSWSNEAHVLRGEHGIMHGECDDERTQQEQFDSSSEYDMSLPGLDDIRLPGLDDSSEYMYGDPARACVVSSSPRETEEHSGRMQATGGPVKHHAESSSNVSVTDGDGNIKLVSAGSTGSGVGCEGEEEKDEHDDNQGDASEKPEKCAVM